MPLPGHNNQDERDLADIRATNEQGVTPKHTADRAHELVAKLAEHQALAGRETHEQAYRRILTATPTGRSLMQYMSRSDLPVAAPTTKAETPPSASDLFFVERIASTVGKSSESREQQIAKLLGEKPQLYDEYLSRLAGETERDD